MKRPHPSTDIDDCDQQSSDISVRQGVVDLRWFPGSWAGDQPVFNTPELFNLERGRRIELLALAWKAKVLPLYEPRIDC